MKKLFVFMFIVLLLCFANVESLKKFSLSEMFPHSMVEIYMSDCPLGIEDCIINGDSVIIRTNIHNTKSIIEKYDYNGITIRINNMTVQQVLNKIFAYDIFEEFDSVYGRCNILCKKILKSNKNVDFQCKKINNGVVLGFPILIGSY